MPGNLERKARRKRQTRLTFDPVDLSSSPSKGMFPTRVRYELGGKTRTPASSMAASLEDDEKKDDPSPAPQRRSGRLPFKPLPTPVKSSQPQKKEEDSEDDLEADQDPKPSSNPRQTPSVVKFMPTIGNKKTQRSLGYNGPYDSSEDEDVTPTKSMSSAKKKTTIVNLISDSDGYHPVTPSRQSKKGPSGSGRATRSSGSKSQKQITIALSDSDDDELVPLAKLGSGSKSRPQRKSLILPRLRTTRSRKQVMDDSDDDDPLVSSPKRSQKPSYQVQQDDEDDDEEDIQTSPIKRRLRRPFVEEEEEEEENDEDEEPIVSPLKRSRPTVESDSDNDASPTKRQRRGTQITIESDSDEPAPKGRSRDSTSATPQRTTRQQKQKRKHRTEREKKMELLKRRRNGDNRELSDSESDNEEDEEDELQQLEEFDDEDEEEEAPVRKPVKGKQKNSENDDAAADSDEFIIDDDENGDIGVPEYNAIPLEFTHQAHKPLKEHFKDAVEWMVHNKINPAFARNDPIYAQAFMKLNDECSGLAKSKFASSQWTQEFTRAVYSRPTLEEHLLMPGEGYDMASGLPICHACNHRKHQPSVVLIFSGKAYDKNSLEDLDQGSSSKSSRDSEDSEDSDEDSRSVNSKGQEIPSTDKRFAVGPVCKVNAQQTHILVHWKYNLNQWVINALEDEGELTPEKLAEREKMKAKKRTRYTNKVVDRWDGDGQLKGLWRDFKNVTTTAREMTAKGRGGWQ